ncbi:uncharacterized protein TRIADDRAFT_26288, partial [Trichoplax adhaerens]
SLIRSAIGKELWRVTMPIHFNEPLSLMQRICEDLEYAYLLNQAAECKDSMRRLALVTAFAVSPFSTTIGRYSKPFNPLLGETFELIDDNLDYCCFCEQVSHHPPVLAMYCEGRTWKLWQEYKFDSKFRGQFLRLSPTGDVHVKFKDNQHHYSWNRPDTIVHNLLIGSMWVDQDGIAKITNYQTQEISLMVYDSWNKAGRSYKNVKCKVRDAKDKIKFELNGAWDSYLDCTSVSGIYSHMKTERLWTIGERPAASTRMYGFTRFAMKLNQLQEGVCPTDSRCRPDQRLMEEGKILEASKEKHRLEEKQRAVRRYRANEKIEYKPRWFVMKKDPDTNEYYHMYAGGYWKARLDGNFIDIPEIF